MPETLVGSRGDQAEGLRRLLGCSETRMITLVSASGGVGKTRVAVQLAAALAARGARVLLIDENAGTANISALLRISPRYTLEAVMRGECGLEDAVTPVRQGISVLAAAGALHALPVLSAVTREQLASAFKRIESRFDVVLADSVCSDSSSGLEAITGASHDTIVVSSPSARSVTAAYALIKRLHHAGGSQRIHVLLNRVAREENARILLENLTDVARSRLRTPVESLGCVPKDDILRAAADEFCVAANTHPVSASSARFRCIADTIACWPSTRARQGFMNQFMQCVLAGGVPATATAGV